MDMDDNLTPLQRSVLEKYNQLSQSLHSLDKSLRLLNKSNDESKSTKRVSPEEILQEMREVEVKIALIGTLLKGSVYSLILQKKNELNLLSADSNMSSTSQ
ncbi:hypothetical protein KAFR_0A04490 [Kazachstania africana CBS 2517]|uniref:DASH complex subunit DAD3 n=1 Tax=Kazachstania africana (strain ATCC 22294 / BCRC 22015 / CBS 2517 / CECT 1963 / NBRC 1671 / NRRL Y-8276) TaxID=1071382 RepID=H2AND4_KAZAF|nr:hypothetical protein KAFR_0A04490 [Kazachstania africana CBS 2517]CCF55884.1 hypothetical protein KAFR_0A04490 [Kazachstania africana CBS 2517]